VALRHAVRRLRRSPVFTATAVLTLALGIGATTAIFTLVHQALLRPLPAVQPDRLWRVGDALRCCYSSGYAQDSWSFFPWEAYRLFRAQTPAFEDLAAFQVGNAALGVRRHGSTGPVVTTGGQYVSGNFFRTLGVSAWRGRVLSDDDDQPGAPLVAVMSHHTWQDKWGSDPSVVGATYQANGHPLTIVGVTPPGFFGAKLADGSMPSLWLPLSAEPVTEGATSRLGNPGTAWLFLIGRARADTDATTLEAQLQVELRQWLASHAGDMTANERAAQPRQTLRLSPGGAGVSLLGARYRQSLLVLLCAAACVLLVGAANVANLMLARGLRDRPQTAVRAALGAGPRRLVWNALSESLTLAVLGAVPGIAMAYAGASLLLRLAFEPGTWVPVSAAPSIPALAFALGISVATAVVCGGAPAWMASRTDPVEALRGGGRHTGHRHWAQKALVSAQVSLSVVLLSLAAMLGQSLRNLEGQDLGFDPRGRYLVTNINTKLAGYAPERLVPLFREIGDRLRAIPGVRMVSPALYAPQSGLYWGREIRVDGKPEPGPRDDVSSAWTRVTPGFFETLGAPIRMGRPITEEDGADTRRVAVVNETFARRFFGGENPIGKHFGPGAGNAGLYEVVGVASDMRYFSEARDAVPMYFVPQAQTAHFDDPGLEGREVWSQYLYNIVIWAPGNPPELGARVTRVLADAGLTASGVRPYSEVIHGGFAQQTMVATLAWLFGSVGLLLAALGLYGVAAYGVEQRTREIGVRAALGADSRSVVALVLRGTLRQVALGLALGIPAAVGTGTLVANQLFGVRPWDPAALCGAALVLALAALLAAAIPARRAARLNPMAALRAE
jgi:predicted permease